MNLFVSFTLVQGYQPVELDTANDTLNYLPTRSVDLRVSYFGATHAPYAAMGLFGGVVTVILPLVLVLIYPTRVFPKLIGCCGLRRWHMIRTFMEVFVGSYKDGTEGGRDYRLTAAMYLIGRIMLGVSWSINKCGFNFQLVQYYSWLVSAVPFILFAVVVTLFKPHRKWSHNVVDALLLLLIAKMCICFHTVFDTTVSEHTVQLIGLLLLIDIAIPQVALCVYCGFKLASWAYSQDIKQLGNVVRGNREDNDDIIQIQRNTNEAQPLLH